jgi:anion-transporting  ArsA/GET3 family ATPase
MELDCSSGKPIEAAQSAQGVVPNGLEPGVGFIIKNLMSSVSGIDEAIAFAELMKIVQEINYSTIVFDTAPTCHTLRLLSFPKTMESAFGKLLELKVSQICIICVINHWPGLVFAEPLCWFINSSNSIYGTRRCRRC